MDAPPIAAAASPALMNNETNNRRPTDRTIPNENSRCLHHSQQAGLVLGFSLPNNIQGVAQFGKHARGSEQTAKQVSIPVGKLLVSTGGERRRI